MCLMVRGVGGVWLGFGLARTEQVRPEDCFATRVLFGMMHARLTTFRLQIMCKTRRDGQVLSNLHCLRWSLHDEMGHGGNHASVPFAPTAA